MKRFLYLLLLLPVLVLADPVTSMPNDVTLTTGRVLRNVKVLRWEKDRVVLRHAGGVDPVAFTLFKIPAPEDLPAIRAADVPAKPAVTSAAPAKERVLTGEVSTAIRGVFHFPNAVVHAYPLSEWDAAAAHQKAKLPDNFATLMGNDRYNATTHAWADALHDVTEVAEATTDATGNFSLTLPPNTDVFLTCTANRRTPRGFEQFSWFTRTTPGATKTDLNDSNHFSDN